MLLRKEVVLNKNDASNFFRTIRDNINDECYEEGCAFYEIVNHYGQSETSVRLFFPIQAKISSPFFEEVLED